MSTDSSNSVSTSIAVMIPVKTEIMKF